ncbi:hypothetical protein RND81_04G069800 [Saponaria officinalis]|uniref:Receptor-like serine/threonine-protein kinase n=1 Tax=Saponaria officinalis TaxID=3572 RepID=A0AAW1LJE2_SAPOF
MLWTYILLIYSCTCFPFPKGIFAANVSTVQLLKDPETLVSENGNYKLGFFSPPNSKNRYLGIWYNNVSPTYYVWVANRNNPLTDSSGVLIVSEEGDVQVTNGNKDVLWSLNLTRAAQNTTRSIKLLNSGDLNVLDHEIHDSSDNGTVLWRSFDYPTDSLLPNMKIAMNEIDLQRLYAWKSASDPSVGRYSLGLDSSNHPQMVIWDGNRRHYRSGPWNGNVFLGMRYADPTADYADTYIQKDDTGDGVKLVYTGATNLTFSHYAFNYNGSLSEVCWDSGSKSWTTLYQDPIDECDFYGKCGAFGACNSGRAPICRCLKGFVPKNAGEWSRGNWTSGCVRNTPLQCGIKGRDQDGFLLLGTVKLPDLEEWLSVLNQNDCRNQCLQNCSCLAYAYDAGAGCMYWSKELIDIQEFTSGGINLYLRLASSELRNKKRKKEIIIATSVILGTSLITLFIVFLWLWSSRRKEKEAKRKHILETIKYNNDKTDPKTKCEELPFFEFGILVDATLNFNISNKLGQGGFGQVYKGKFKDGQEIAVKRLSAASGQGLEEFRNEVIVISRLQHMNLVKLIGFCVEGEEKLLVYEYMPNKSLSAFLFDPTKREILDWRKRLLIIEGICRGLIYLHRDSRLRIIHRDLKASNILLDEELNPKISDFGMARIFKHGQDRDETRRVVGTYGYMAPEYAMEGHFSEKSDVYSFGVLLLEIVSGRRNSSFWFEEESLTLVGYVWKLWIEGEALSIIDPTISDPNYTEEIKRSIQVGLLCVQEGVKERPSTSTVMSMLSSDIDSLPRPKQPGFYRRLNVTDDGSSQHQSSGGNNMSITALSAR